MMYLIFAAIGVSSVVGIILYLFSTIGKNANPLRISESYPSVRSEQFLLNAAVASNASLTNFSVEQCKVFSENRQYFESLLDDIGKAKKSIALMTYVWEEDEISERVFVALKAACQRGVMVRLLIDAYGNTITKRRLRELSESGVRVVLFRPFAPGKISRYYSRVHRRAYIFDGQIGYFGGSAISKRWFKTAKQNDYAFDDIMYRVTGEPVLPIAAAFGELWSAYGGVIAQDLYVPHPKTKPTPISKNALALAHSPQVDVHPLTYLLWYSCMCAQDSITIVNPYFIPGHALVELLCSKAKAGVRVKIITQGTNQMWYVRAASQYVYDTLLECGVEIYEHMRPHLHSKVMIVDEHLTLCGSANFDIRSQRINFELVLAVQSDEFARQNLAIFKEYKPVAKPIELDSWRKRSWRQQLVERLVSQFNEQL